MKVYVINLKDAVERRESIEKQLKELELEYTIFEAIKGSSLSFDELEGLVDMEEVRKYPDWLTPNMLGAALSHLEVYKNFINTNADWSLVLEDDVLLNNDIKLIIDHVKCNEHIYQDQLILFYGVVHEGNLELSKNYSTSNGKYVIYNVLSKAVGGAGAYMVHRSTANKLVNSIKKVKVAPDTWDFFKSQGVFSQINCIYPFAARPGLFESTIGYVDKSTTIYKLKHFIEKHKIPFLYYLLRSQRKKIWQQTSKVVFK